jgi:hypothetical protein
MDMSNTIPEFGDVEQFADDKNADYCTVEAHCESEHADARWVRYGFRNGMKTIDEVEALVCFECGVEVQCDIPGVSHPVADLNSVKCETEEEVDVLSNPTEWFESLSPDVDVGDEMRVQKESLEYQRVEAGWVVQLGEGSKHLIADGGGSPRCSCAYRDNNESCVHEFALTYNRQAEQYEDMAGGW